MSNRKPLSKRLRFEIFKRDGFRCLYCGANPNQRPLQVDHVEPVALGGTDDPFNLVTACVDCNGGKSAVPLDQRAHAAPVDTEAHYEQAEQIREWLAVQREVEAARTEVADAIAEHWEHHLGPISQMMYDRLPKLAREFSIEDLAAAMAITARKMGREREFRPAKAHEHARYFQGILRRWRTEGVQR